MKRKHAMWAAAAATLSALLIGYLALQSGADAVSEYPNDKANHHPKHAADPTK